MVGRRWVGAGLGADVKMPDDHAANEVGSGSERWIW